ncbi:hypothetical protein KKF91_07080 [Myxococcota bacterium]|nr:hypothetical protein [Myxococcota bacterium]MBU1430315.1 hypothetical protein [Myxococcota bacterium]MBU1900601.1 hypothetical protein [Myxococcota bacterium]
MRTFDPAAWAALIEAHQRRPETPRWLVEAMRRLLEHRQAFGVEAEREAAADEIEFIYPH